MLCWGSILSDIWSEIVFNSLHAAEFFMLCWGSILSDIWSEIVFNSLHAGEFFMLCCRLLIFFKINIFKKFFQEYHQSVKQFGSRSGPTFCPDLGPNCLQRLSADDKLWLARKELRGL